MLLTGKVIFITGGSKGIGRECARLYADEGAQLALMATDEQVLNEVVADLDGEHLGFAGDISRSSDVEEAIRYTLQRFGRIDAIHNNAGIAHPAKALHDTTEEEWGRLLDVNLKSVYLTTRFGLEELKKSRGCILNTSSLVGEIGQEMHAAYTATKGAMNALTKSMALDYAPYHIRVNAVAPAGVWTPMLKKWCREQADGDSTGAYLNDIHPLGYCPEGDVVAEACLFLISDKARFITGCVLPVSGGAELGYRRKTV
jgi:NAD(P)-dependent dehydrogenase (short-subunit alcohol dehydrogenase family)